MIDRNDTLVHRYAQAFVHVFGASIEPERIERFNDAAAYIKRHKEITIFLSLPCVNDQHKYGMIERVCKQLDLNVAIYKLTALLLKHKRAVLLAPVLAAIAHALYEQHNVEYFTIESFPVLDQSEQERVSKRLSSLTQRSILYRYQLNKKLIAGIRARSASYMYEDSVAGQLRAIKQALTE